MRPVERQCVAVVQYRFGGGRREDRSSRVEAFAAFYVFLFFQASRRQLVAHGRTPLEIVHASRPILKQPPLRSALVIGSCRSVFSA